MHKQKTDSTKRSKCARYIEPVILVNDNGNYENVLTSCILGNICYNTKKWSMFDINLDAINNNLIILLLKILW